MSLFDLSSSAGTLNRARDDPAPPYPVPPASPHKAAFAQVSSFQDPTLEEAREMWKRERPYYVELVRQQEVDAATAEHNRVAREARRARREARRERQERAVEREEQVRLQEERDEQEVEEIRAIEKDAVRKERAVAAAAAAAAAAATGPSGERGASDQPTRRLQPRRSQSAKTDHDQETSGFLPPTNFQPFHPQPAAPLRPYTAHLPDHDPATPMPTPLDRARSALFNEQADVFIPEYFNHLHTHGVPTLSGASFARTVAAAPAPDPAVADFAAQADPRAYSQHIASGPYSVPQRSFSTVEGRFASFTGGRWREAGRELSEEEAELAKATGKVEVLISRQKAAVKTLLSPIIS